MRELSFETQRDKLGLDVGKRQSCWVAAKEMRW